MVITVPAEIQRLFSVFTDTATPDSKQREAKRAAAQKVWQALIDH